MVFPHPAYLLETATSSNIICVRCSENYFGSLLTFVDNVSRIALAIDYEGNGYRSLMPLALQSAGLQDALLAVSASHLSRWQNTSDTSSHAYLRRAAIALKERLSDPQQAQDQTTIALVLLFISYEVNIKPDIHGQG